MPLAHNKNIVASELEQYNSFVRVPLRETCLVFLDMTFSIFL